MDSFIFAKVPGYTKTRMSKNYINFIFIKNHHGVKHAHAFKKNKMPLKVKKVKVAHSCLTSLWHHGLCSLPGESSVRGISQPQILEWVAIPFSRRSSWPRDWTWISRVPDWFFTVWDAREALKPLSCFPTLPGRGNFTCLAALIC